MFRLHAVNFTAKRLLVYYARMNLRLGNCYRYVTGMLRNCLLKPELEPAGKYIILHISGITGELCFFIDDPVVP